MYGVTGSAGTLTMPGCKLAVFRSTNILLLLYSVCIPVLLATITLYGLIVKAAVNHEEQIRNSINQVNDEANRVQILKATKVFMVIVGLYVVTWIPFIIINTLMFFVVNPC